MLPIAHHDGAYFIDKNDLKKLEDENRIIFRYCDENGKDNIESNPNVSVSNIAGVINKEGNILGLMPHPERACENELGGTNGKLIFDSIISCLNRCNTN